MPNAAGQSPHRSLGTDLPSFFSFKPQLYTHAYRHSGMQKSTHRKTLTSPVFIAFFMLLPPTQKLPLYESGGDVQDYNRTPAPEVLFYWEPITDNSQISLSLMKMYACTQPALIVLIRRKGACTCVRVHVPELSLCMYSMCVSAHVYVCRIHDEHLCTAQRRVQATCSIFMCFPICDPAL